MSYKIVNLGTFYQVFVNDFYRKNPHVAEQGYQQQWRTLMDTGAGWADFYSKNFRDIGVECTEIVWNAEPLQSAWSRENAFTGDSRAIVMEQIRRLAPDVLFMQDAINFPVSWLQELREKVPSLRGVMGWCAAPYSETDIERFRLFDLMLSCSQKFVHEFEALGMKARLQHHGFEPSILSKIQPGPRTTDLLFAGSLVQGRGFHQGRTDLLLSLLDHDVKMKVLADAPKANRDMAKKILAMSATTLQEVGLSSVVERIPLLARATRFQDLSPLSAKYKKLRKVCKPPQFGYALYRELARSKMSLNFHIDVAGDYAANVRLFETTGVGACLVTDAKKNMSDLFEPDQECVTYSSPEECLEKIQWLLANPKKLAEIAAAGQKRCLEQHSFRKRTEALDRLVRHELLK